MPFVAFDLQGTLFTFNKVITQLQERLTPHLTDNKTAKQFFEYWYNTALRDAIASSQAGTYQSLRTVMRAGLERAILCYFDNDESTVSSATIDVVMTAAFDEMELDREAVTAMQLLLDDNARHHQHPWDIWIVSSFGGLEETRTLLQRTELARFVGEGNIICPDELKISKPHPKVYSELMRMAVHKTKRIENFYLVGSHAYDLAGAKNVAFKTVFLNTIERVYVAPVTSVTFQPYNDNASKGEQPDMIGSSLIECVTKMIDYEHTKRQFMR
ncbi:MAG: hypothetical protein EXX96DRAFT_587286 [Benjaminiella poitrasii]|nr:MAG: hypothetical protein EXX96DRAFT_587286 [Benjaminiella poitrasii]